MGIMSTHQPIFLLPVQETFGQSSIAHIDLHIALPNKDTVVNTYMLGRLMRVRQLLW